MANLLLSRAVAAAEVAVRAGAGADFIVRNPDRKPGAGRGGSWVSAVARLLRASVSQAAGVRLHGSRLTGASCFRGDFPGVDLGLACIAVRA
jgi:hypothetical protein